MPEAPTIRSELGPTLKLAVPIMLGMLGYGLMFVVDVAMAGHLGETALAASALALGAAPAWSGPGSPTLPDAVPDTSAPTAR